MQTISEGREKERDTQTQTHGEREQIEGETCVLRTENGGKEGRRMRLTFHRFCKGTLLSQQSLHTANRKQCHGNWKKADLPQ